MILPTSSAYMGVKAYFQAGYLDSTNPVWPMPVSDVWSTTYK